jgi:predicted CopG family antitoxin
MSSYVCNELNWQLVAERIALNVIREKYEWKKLIEKFDDNCFFIALKRANSAVDVVYWRLKSNKQKAFATYIRKVIRLKTIWDNDVQMKCGTNKHSFLLQEINSDKLAFEMGCDYAYSKFDITELTEKDFPEFKPYCARKHINTIDIEEDVYQTQDTMEGRVHAILDMFRDHYKTCVEDQ